jgi:hypothetical protein
MDLKIWDTDKLGGRECHRSVVGWGGRSINYHGYHDVPNSSQRNGLHIAAGFTARPRSIRIKVQSEVDVSLQGEEPVP